MNEKKYFLVNGKIPCICTCHKECLRHDLIHRGYNVISMEEISEKTFTKLVATLKKANKNIKFQYTYY